MESLEQLDTIETVVSDLLLLPDMVESQHCKLHEAVENELLKLSDAI